MKKENFSEPINLRRISVNDSFWKKEMELVRTEVIPYQWDAINDNVPGAAPSYCMRNYKVAGRINEEQRAGTYKGEPAPTFRGFEILPDDPEHPDDDEFYGFVFQDTDFSKWLEAVGYSLTQHPDSNLESLADGAIDIVCRAQQDDGYLDTYYIIRGRDKTFTNLRDHHELYCLGHLIEGAVAYYEATGKDKILNTAMRFADYVFGRFGDGPGRINGYPGHEIAEMALVRLYKVTGNEKYLELASYFIDERGRKPYYFDREDHPDVKDKSPDRERYIYFQAHRPVREQNEAVGHAVRAVYLYSGMADIAKEKGDDTLLEACERLWDSITGEKLYVTGGIGSTHIGESFSFPFDLPNDTAYAETCASIGLVFFAQRMLRIKADSRYSDVMERALYNGILSGMALDGKSFFYVNPLEVDPAACAADERKFHVKSVRQKWFGCACCPPNIARLVSSIGSYAYTESENTFYIHLYIGAAIKKGSSQIIINSDMPWEGRASVTVKNAVPGFVLALRLPGWADDHDVTGTERFDTKVVDGYMYVSGEWSDETVIGLEFEMRPRLMASDSRVRENAGRVSLERGPVVYCLEEKDNGAMLHQLAIDPDGSFDTEPFEICGEHVNMITADGFRYGEAKKDPGLFAEYIRPSIMPVRLRFIPYYTWANRGENEMSVYISLPLLDTEGN